MTITSKSLFHANVVFLYEEGTFVPPGNDLFPVLYAGPDAAGARFTDNPAFRTKVLVLPAKKLRVILERSRLRVDDESGEEGRITALPEEALGVLGKLQIQGKLDSYGFNFELFYRFSNVIPMRAVFEAVLGTQPLAHSDLRDLGIQCTLERPQQRCTDTFFLKVASPMELAVHVHRNVAGVPVPSADRLVEQMLNCYTEADAVAKEFGGTLSVA